VKMRAAGLALTFLLVTIVPAQARGSGPTVSAPDAIVVDGWTGGVLFAKHPDSLHDPASTVKIMTALIVLERHIPLRRVVTISWLASSSGGSTAGLFAGEQMTVRNLLYGMLLPSGNDAAVALSEAVGGTVARFIELMNREALRLHMRHTHYVTPDGFDTSGQVTTARDLAILTRAAMQWPVFVRVVRTRFWSAWDAYHRLYHRWENLNKLLWQSRAVDGVKTGTTPGAGACLVSSARKDRRWVIAVNLGSAVPSRFSDGAALLDYGLPRASDLPQTN